MLRRARRRLEAGGRDDEPATLLSREDHVVGTVDEVVARLRDYERAGVERVFLQHLDHADIEMVDLIAAEVLPSLV